MHSACNRAKWVCPFNSNAPSMEVQAHASCNRRAGCYVRATAPPLAPLPRLLDCGTSTATRGKSSVHVVSQAYVPSRGSERTLSHGVKTARP
jgi:hypothetical protein